MIPIIALVGRPNVGKSTLFNTLTKTRNALVADIPGVTRDRQYGDGKVGDKPFIVVDTGGIFENSDVLTAKLEAQVAVAIADADEIFFVVDAKAGITSADLQLAELLRRQNRNIQVIANKCDGVSEAQIIADFAELAMGTPHMIAAKLKRGTTQLMTVVLHDYLIVSESEQTDGHIKVAIVGRPNVGKSTLVNRILKEERVIAFDAPGTTRDSIFIPWQHDGREYILIDTAGVRKNKQAADVVERFSINKTLQAIKVANVVVMMVDGSQNLVDQDLKLLQFIVETGKGLVIAINKWDGLSHDDKENIKEELKRRLTFVDFANIRFISALHGSGVGKLYQDMNQAYDAAMRELPTSQLTRILEYAIEAHQPPLVNGRRIKLRYAHAGGQNPPRIIIHGKQCDELPNSYTRYLEKTFRKQLNLIGTPIAIEYKTDDNPYV